MTLCYIISFQSTKSTDVILLFLQRRNPVNAACSTVCYVVGDGDRTVALADTQTAIKQTRVRRTPNSTITLAGTVDKRMDQTR